MALRSRQVVVAGIALFLATISTVVVGATPASAHPLGNFTINTSVTLTVRATAIDARLVVDMAEIPALQTKQRLDTDKDQTPSASEQSAYRSSTCEALAGDLHLRLDGRDTPFEPTTSTLAFPPGQAGLTTLRLECKYRTTTVLDGATKLSVRSSAYGDRVGWREIVVAGDRMTIVGSSVPSKSPSGNLTAYPSAKLQSPLRQESATATIRPGGPALDREQGQGPTSPLPRGIDAPTRAFASFVGRQQLGFGVGAIALALSLVLGAIHALAPGHGKTVMAAYLVGQKGSPRQAAALGLTVTATHTLGVLALGVAIAASKIITPERLYPYLGMISGLLLAAIGLNLLRNARRARQYVRNAELAASEAHLDDASHDHDHPHETHSDHSHDHPHEAHSDHGHGEHRHDDHAHVEHGDLTHDDHGGHHQHGEREHAPEPVLVSAGAAHGAAQPAGRRRARGIAAAVPAPDADDWHAHGGSLHRHAPIAEGQPLTWSSLLALGFVGGFLPSPSAVVVLLRAIALGRAWFGVLLVIAYGLGMATTLMAAGLLLVRARGALERRLHRLLDRNGSRILNTVLPFGTAIVIIVVGLVLAGQGANSIGG